MKQDELQQKARNELSKLGILGINVTAVKKAQEKLENEAKDTIEEDTIEENTTVNNTIVKDAIEENTIVVDNAKERVEIRSNYFKYDNDISDILARSQTPIEQVIYNRMVRLSYGFHRNTCRVGMGRLAEACNISSPGKTVKKAIDGLIEKGHIAVIDEHGNNKKGTLYRIYLPCEIPTIESSTIVENTIVENNRDTTAKSTIVGNTREISNNTEKGNTATVVNPTIVNIPTNKYLNNNKNNTLSQEKVIYQFYGNIGHKSITKAKRESAEKCLKELMSEGFNLEDVVLAIKWTLKNLKEQPYDFSILKHTISQAMAEKEKIEEGKARLHEQEQIAIQEKDEEERTERERTKIEAIKDEMNPDERAKLRERAIQVIRSTEGVKEEFITETLIECQENEILRDNA